MDLKLSGLVAVVTGGSKGIGPATVRTFLEEGARLVASSRHTSADLEALRSPDLLHVPADLTDPDAPARLITKAIEAFGGLDILVNNAGFRPPARKCHASGS